MTNEYSILQPILSEQEALNILTRMAGGVASVYTQKFSFKLKLPFTINYNRTNSNRLTIAHAGIGGNALAQASATWREIR